MDGVDECQRESVYLVNDEPDGSECLRFLLEKNKTPIGAFPFSVNRRDWDMHAYAGRNSDRSDINVTGTP